MSVRLPNAAAKVLLIYGLLPESEREKLARVRRLNPDGSINHPPKRDIPPDLRALVERLRPIVGDQSKALRRLVARRTAQITERNPMSEFGWTAVQQCADIEVQSVLWAIVLRKQGLLIDGEYEAMTRAWREAVTPV